MAVTVVFVLLGILELTVNLVSSTRIIIMVSNDTVK